MSHTPKPPLIPRRHISTQALDTETVSAIAEQLRRIEQIRSTRPHNTPLDSIEELPLDAAESIIGLQAQGDAHRNDLELLYDRIMGHAEAPIHTGTTPAPAPAPALTLPRDPLSEPLAAGVTLALHLTYPEGPADVESMVVDAGGERLWLIEKEAEREARVWEHDLRAVVLGDERPYECAEIARFSSPGVGPPIGHLATAADLTPDGERLALRVYTGVYEYLLPAPYALNALGALTPRLVRLGPLAEPQGEALCYGWGGEGLWTGSESPRGEQPLHFQGCE